MSDRSSAAVSNNRSSVDFFVLIYWQRWSGGAIYYTIVRWAKPSPFCGFCIIPGIPLIESNPSDTSAKESFANFGCPAGRITSVARKRKGIAGLAIPV